MPRQHLKLPHPKKEGKFLEAYEEFDGFDLTHVPTTRTIDHPKITIRDTLNSLYMLRDRGKCDYSS